MDKTLLTDITAIRLCVGLLGEVGLYSWWPSSFFSATSIAFLTPVFSRTCFSAQYYGVKEAATIIHDEHIGVGKSVFHLFRLPEIHEIEMHNLLENPETVHETQQVVSNKNTAQQFLQDYSESSDVKEFGPIRLGDTKKISNRSTWKKIARYYAEAFKKKNKIFPYFSTVE